MFNIEVIQFMKPYTYLTTCVELPVSSPCSSGCLLDPNLECETANYSRDLHLPLEAKMSHENLVDSRHVIVCSFAFWFWTDQAIWKTWYV